MDIMDIINLTQHDPTPAQLGAGVLPRSERTAERTRTQLTIRGLPTKATLNNKAEDLCAQARALSLDFHTKTVMVGGHGALMAVDIPQEDGSVKKVFTFNHIGFC